ncbi:MAG: hypothetical protein AAGC57_14490 [Pseudomonadota bacterium]
MTNTRVAHCHRETPDPAEFVSVCLERARHCAFRAQLDRRIDCESLTDLERCSGCPFQDETLSLLLKLMPMAFGRRVVFHRPGASDTTFDEAWLLRLIESVRNGDEASATFALCSRVERRLRPAMRNLAKRCAENLDAPGLELF